MNKLNYKTSLQGFIIALIIFFSGVCLAQEDIVYFNKLWLKCEKSEAKYFRIVEETDSLLKVTDYYIKGAKQSEGYVENTKSNAKILSIRGDFESKIVGEFSYYTKKGKLDYTVNDHPFDEKYGITKEQMGLLDSLDTTDIDLSKLSFYTYFDNGSKEYGFLLNDEDMHGTWIMVETYTGILLNRSHYYKGRTHGLVEVYSHDGTLREKKTYTHGTREGEHFKYNRNGRLVESKIYTRGFLIETWRYSKPKKKK